MAQYKYLARKPLRTSGTGPKIQGIRKTSVATPPRVRPDVGRTTATATRAACGSYSAGGSDTTVGIVADPDPVSRGSTTGNTTPSSACTRKPDEFGTNGISSSRWSEQVQPRRRRHTTAAQGGGGRWVVWEREGRRSRWRLGFGITDSACKNQLVVVSVQYGPFNTYIPIRSTTIGISRVAIDPIAMHTSWRSNSDITSVTRKTHLPKTHPVLRPEIYHTIISSDSIGYPRIKASGESSTTKHRLLHSSGPHPIPPPNDPK
ncbi:hypothetical protein F511_16519 [Dorcoceras hygrometricum]|uniref:Uncharacterized protein n=1 Tax=Dorcoceras hygrometricum TaxID=472368 RepID=A0A2Z7BEK9_9LAMI|nr:hypothetical protein F511_16519 [Dorcoceras hygrometricum]